MKFRVTGEDQSRAYRLARVEAMPEVLDEKEKAALHNRGKGLWGTERASANVKVSGR